MNQENKFENLFFCDLILPYFTFFLGGPMGGICWLARALNASAMRCGWEPTICFQLPVSITSVTWRVFINSIAWSKHSLINMRQIWYFSKIFHEVLKWEFEAPESRVNHLQFLLWKKRKKFYPSKFVNLCLIKKRMIAIYKT